MDQFPRWRGNDGFNYTDDFYLYNIGPGTNGTAGSLTTGQTAQTNLTIQADSNFEWIYSTAYANVTASDEPIADNQLLPITLLITDGGSGRQLFSQAMPLSTFAGLGREPYVMPKKRIFMGKSTVNFFWTNIGASTWDNISLTLHGRKIFQV